MEVSFTCIEDAVKASMLARLRHPCLRRFHTGEMKPPLEISRYFTHFPSKFQEDTRWYLTKDNDPVIGQ